MWKLSKGRVEYWEYNEGKSKGEYDTEWACDFESKFEWEIDTTKEVFVERQYKEKSKWNIIFYDNIINKFFYNRQLQKKISYIYEQKLNDDKY